MSTFPIPPLVHRASGPSPTRGEPRFTLVVEPDDARAPPIDRRATFLVARRDLVRLLESGAVEDVVVVPCREAHAPDTAPERPPPSPEPDEVPRVVLHVGPLDVDLLAREARVDGRAVELTRREFDLLVFFCRNQGRALRREELLTQVWQTTRTDMQRTIDIHVRRLRAKLGSAFALDTVYRVGYRFPSPPA
jgi:DNA-binding response OmpR family regulator